MKSATALILLLLAGPVEDGEAAWTAGRHEDAWRAWSRALQAAGEEAPAALLFNLSLAALKTGRLLEAEVAAEKAAARGGSSWLSLRDFVLGNVAYARGRESERLAARPEAGPPALDAAIAGMERAIGHWLRALEHREDWPGARRNIERAALRLDALRKKRERLLQQGRRKGGAGRQRVRPGAGKREAGREPPDRPAGAPAGQTPFEAAPQLHELSSQQVRGLLQKLAAKQDRKRALRAARQRALRARVERDW